MSDSSSVETPSVEPVETTPVEAPPLLLRIVKGDPTPEEVAALVSVVSALAADAQAADASPRRKSEWAAPRRRLRGTHRHGPGAWRASAR